MIDTTRPVRGQDLIDLRNSLGLTMQDTIWLFGISSNRWSELTRPANALKPLGQTMAPIAIFARILDAHPELCLVPKMPSMREVFEKFTEIDPTLNMKEVSLLVGRESSSGFQWLQCSRRSSPQVARLSYVMMKMIENDARNNGQHAMLAIKHFVKTEANARGITDLSKNHSWGLREEGSHKKGRRPKAKVEEASA